MPSDFSDGILCVLGMGTFSRVQVPSAGGSAKRIAGGKGVRREAGSERSPRQTVGPTNRNRIRHTRVGESAEQDEAQQLHGPEVYMRRIDDGKERVLTRGGLTDAALKGGGVKLAVRSQQRS